MSSDSPAPASAASAAAPTAVTMVAKYGKEKIELTNLPSTSTNVGRVKELLREKTGILPKRQKLIGLKGKGAVTDETLLSDLKAKGGGNGVVTHQFILMGTREEEVFIDPSEKEDLPDVIDDFDFDFNAGSDEVCCDCCLASMRCCEPCLYTSF